MNMNIKLFLTTVLFLSLTKAFGQSKEKVIDDYFNALVKNQQFSGNVLVIDNNKVIYERSFGFSDHTAKTPNTPVSLFPLTVSQRSLRQQLFFS